LIAKRYDNSAVKIRQEKLAGVAVKGFTQFGQGVSIPEGFKWKNAEGDVLEGLGLENSTPAHALKFLLVEGQNFVTTLIPIHMALQAAV